MISVLILTHSPVSWTMMLWTRTPCIGFKVSLFGSSSYRFVLLLQLPQLAPANILFSLGGVGVFVTLYPEPEPVDGAALRNHACGWVFPNTCTPPNNDKHCPFIQKA